MVTNNSVNSSASVIQIVGLHVGSLIDCSSPAIPSDDTIPQNTEGVEVITLAITPKFSTSNLFIQFSGCVNAEGGYGGVAALFQDSTAGALSSRCYDEINSSARIFMIQHTMTSGTTSSTTFKIRIGGEPSGSFWLNGNTAGGALYDGTGAAFLTITEYI